MPHGVGLVGVFEGLVPVLEPVTFTTNAEGQATWGVREELHLVCAPYNKQTRVSRHEMQCPPFYANRMVKSACLT